MDPRCRRAPLAESPYKQRLVRNLGNGWGHDALLFAGCFWIAGSRISAFLEAVVQLCSQARRRGDASRVVWRELGGNDQERKAGTRNWISFIFTRAVWIARYDARKGHRGVPSLCKNRSRA